MPSLRSFAVLAALVWVGCADPADRPADWSYIHATIVVPSCATARCHSSLTAKAGVDLSDEQGAYDYLLGEQWVVPGDDQSELLYLLRGEQRLQMPPDAPLPAADIDLVEQWILDGAARQ